MHRDSCPNVSKILRLSLAQFVGLFAGFLLKNPYGTVFIFIYLFFVMFLFVCLFSKRNFFFFKDFMRLETKSCRILPLTYGTKCDMT